MTKVYIHIGSPKTGTTAIQGYLSQYYHDMHRQGLLFPCSGRNVFAHHPLAGDVRTKFNNDKIPEHCFGECERGLNWDALLGELSEKEFSTAVISSEDFFILYRTGNTQAMEYIKDRLRAYDVRVIVYLRRQDEFVDSLFNQAIKCTLQTPNNSVDFINKHPTTRKNYKEILDAWVSVFGKDKIIVRPFEKGALLGGDVVLDFLAAIGGYHKIENTNVKNNKIIQKVKAWLQPKGKFTVNERLTPCELILKRQLNRYSTSNLSCISMFEKIRNKVLDREKQKALLMSESDYQRIVEESKPVNKKIEQEYLKGGRLFLPFPEDRKFENLEQVSCTEYLKRVAREKYTGLSDEEKNILSLALKDLNSHVK